MSCSATNGAGLASFQSVTLKRDATTPTITGLPVPGSCILWPPNHKLVTVATIGGSAGISGLLPGSFLVTGASNEPPGHFAPDIVITGGLVQLRAERLGDGTGRIYTLMATVKNKAGTSASATATCTVPHDQGN